MASSRILRFVLGILGAWTKMDNPVSRFFRPCCSSCNFLLNTTIPWCKDAYTDVAMSGRAFVEAAINFRVLSKYSSQSFQTLQILRGATWLFQVFGVCAAACIGAVTMFVYSRGHDVDPHDTYLLACSGAVISFSTAMLFIMIFDTVSNTILYCIVVEQLRLRRDVPEASGKVGNAVMAMFCPCAFYRRELGLFLLGEEPPPERTGSAPGDSADRQGLQGDLEGPPAGGGGGGGHGSVPSSLGGGGGGSGGGWPGMPPVHNSAGDGGCGSCTYGSWPGAPSMQATDCEVGVAASHLGKGGGRPGYAPVRSKGKGRGKGPSQVTGQAMVLAAYS